MIKMNLNSFKILLPKQKLVQEILEVFVINIPMRALMHIQVKMRDVYDAVNEDILLDSVYKPKQDLVVARMVVYATGIL